MGASDSATQGKNAGGLRSKQVAAEVAVTQDKTRLTQDSKFAKILQGTAAKDEAKVKAVSAGLTGEMQKAVGTKKQIAKLNADEAKAQEKVATNMAEAAKKLVAKMKGKATKAEAKAKEAKAKDAEAKVATAGKKLAKEKKTLDKAAKPAAKKAKKGK